MLEGDEDTPLAPAEGAAFLFAPLLGPARTLVTTFVTVAVTVTVFGASQPFAFPLGAGEANAAPDRRAIAVTDANLILNKKRSE